ncbi:MAG TPA: hypothetical protein VMT62_13030 [Syntrophorhabdaceae bacterium]|nr:hypothetical protein [Syntrophorhabdaceae bacterium]
MTNERGGTGYEVLSPWAEAGPVPVKGITPRLKDLAGKHVGLFANTKRAANLILSAVEGRIKQNFPTVTTSWYASSEPNVPEKESKNGARFETWVKGVDAVILAVGD